MNQEPATDSPAVRRFTDPAYRPIAANLAQIREGIDRIDEQIVALLAQRAALVQDATRFKADAFQVSAPARQAQVFARVRALAEAQPNLFPRFATIVESTYRTLVAGFVDCEQAFFAGTEPVPAASNAPPTDRPASASPSAAARPAGPSPSDPDTP